MDLRNEVLTMYYDESLTVDEIAEALCQEIDTVLDVLTS